MASTLAKVRAAVRFRIRDVGGPEKAIPTFELNEIIQANTRYVSGCVPLGETWAASLVTLTIGSELVSMAANLYSDILAVRRHDDGYLLTKRTREELDKLYWQSGIAATVGSADPTDYALIEDSAQLVTLRFQAPAKSATALDVCRRVLPEDMVADTAAIPFSTLAVEAVIDLSAFEALSKLTPALLEARKLNPAVGGLWAKRAEENIRHETERLHRQRGVGRPLRFVP